jgi:transposase
MIDKMLILFTLSEKEKNLDVLKEKGFHSSKDMVKSVEEELNGFNSLVEMKYNFKGIKFLYELKHKYIQRRTKRFGYTVLIINTGIAVNDLLKIYKKKDAVEKSFSHIKPFREPLFLRSEEGTRARMFLTVFGYTLLAIIAKMCRISYNQALNIISGMREPYTHQELTLLCNIQRNRRDPGEA